MAQGDSKKACQLPRTLKNKGQHKISVIEERNPCFLTESSLLYSTDGLDTAMTCTTSSRRQTVASFERDRLERTILQTPVLRDVAERVVRGMKGGKSPA